MSDALVINVRIHEGRYHGAGDWPPAPARLFQALVAGAGLSGPLAQKESRSLQWLEGKCESTPPVIGAPAAWIGRQVMFYMPNNDLDKVGGDPHRMAEIRTATKLFKPHFFNPEVPFLYMWALEQDEDHETYSRVICELAERVYQLGRGVDFAWAWGEVLNASEVERRLADYPGRIYRPSGDVNAQGLLCPQKGSFESIEARYQAYSRRFDQPAMFSQPSRPRFRRVGYESPSSRRIYDLGVALPLTRASGLVVRLRDLAVDGLRKALPGRAADIERALVGRKPDGTNAGPTSARVRIVPLPSIGHPHADRAIRRVLVEVPASCPIPADDVHWAFSGLEFIDPDSGEVLGATLTPATDDRMLEHYGVGERPSSCIWRSVTPVALPDLAARRRIEPTRRTEEAKAGRERVEELGRAVASVKQALRHAEVHTRTDVIRVQREPFDGSGARVEAFAEGTRFAKERLWHVEVTFGASVSGPLVIGDGRFLGLGMMAPLARRKGLHSFVVEAGLVGMPDPTEVVCALRRAVMARVQEVLGASAALPAFFSGHERDGSPARSESSPHLAFGFHTTPRRILVVAPHVLDRREPTAEEKRNLATLEEALENLRELRAGSAGKLALRAVWMDMDTDVLTAPSRTWESVTPYHVTRHTKQGGAAEAFATDLRAECRRRGLPVPCVTPLELRGIPNIGLVGRARLEFAVALRGPIILGKSRYRGGGLFAGIHGESV